VIKPAQFSPLARACAWRHPLRMERLWNANQRKSQHRKRAGALARMPTPPEEEINTLERNVVVGNLGGLHQFVSLRWGPLVVR
jgi:hypothetical protein